MARPQSRYVCQTCGDAVLRWEGQCRACGAWNSLVETVIREPSRVRRSGAGHVAAASGQPLTEIGATHGQRQATGLVEVDRVLGGGVVAGSVILLGGEPGIGKSTLLLQVASGLLATSRDARILYATGEESAEQVHLRAARLGLLETDSAPRISVLAEHDVEAIVAEARAGGHAAVIVDSVQTITSDDLDGAAGSVGQVREATVRLMDFAKRDGVSVILAGHVTKDGSIAGPKTLEHLVDAVVNLEGERFAALRILRASKNRFGSTEEVGVFEMAERGLVEVADPARAFMVEHATPAAGSVIAPTLEGSRPLLVEIQALVSPATYGNPVRRASGLDQNRLNLLTAVLGRRAGISLGSHDVYANLAGGLAVNEPGLDLPLSVAMASSLRDRPVPSGTVVIGEVGLLGELRTVAGLERRLREAARLGFERAIVPRASRDSAPLEVSGIRIHRVDTLRDAIDVGLAEAAGRGDTAPAMLG